jgi:hypothetical protein
MNKERLDTYAELPENDGIQTLFRKFNTNTYIFQYNKAGELIGSVCVSNENMDLIRNAPSIEIGDSKTKQTI